MKTFKHHNAQSIREAASLLASYQGKAKANAGGTDLLGAMRDKCIAEYPEALVNLKSIRDLDYIKKDKKGIKIGALARLADIANSAEVKEEYPLLAEAAHSVASPNVRNMATIGGNLAQDVRCWYYRYPQQIGGPIVCLRKGGKTCNALAGDNRYHSLFGAAPLDENSCASHCPAHINIPFYLSRVREGDLPEAARILMDYNPFPAITGRICPAFCETGCNRQEFDDSVGIQSIERGVGDYILERAAEYYAPAKAESGKKVAIVGSGPAGLAAAFYLRSSGHQVTIFEKRSEPGGMLLYSIPPFRLPKEVVRNLISALKGMGIIFKVGINVGKKVTLAELRSRFNAVFLASGTWKSLKLGVPGEKAKGVYDALNYLSKINCGEKVPLGKKVIVIGGGSVAVDAARTARRLGAEEVHIICLETRDLSSKDRMLAQDKEIFEAEEEGINIHSSLGVHKILVKDGKAYGIETVKCLSVREPDGTFNPRYAETSSDLSLQGESIIVAIGQTVDQSLSAGRLKYDETGVLSVDTSTAETGINNVFAAGDMVSGPSTVVQALASARRAARAINTRLKAKLPSIELSRLSSDYIASSFNNIPRTEVLELPAGERIRNIDVEDRPGLSMSQIETEAQRCFNCGCLAVSPSDLGIALVALEARIITTKRTIPAQAFFKASATQSTALGKNELIKEIQIPSPPDGSRQNYLKFTLRKPIDFAVASVASVITVKEGVCSDARITLGALAPAPLRAKASEESLKGKSIDESRAIQAANLAVAGALPLSMNAYKAEIAKTLVKRAILGKSS